MKCVQPLDAFQLSDGTVVLSDRRGDVVKSLLLPCGRCIGCRLDRARDWAARIMHEAQLHEVNSFVTLTYARAVPSLDYNDFRKFLKRLRRERPVRYFMSGEYGEKFARPHFHAILFGVSFPDQKYLKLSAAGEKLYTSVALSRLWPHGFASVGTVTAESAAYVARYTMKKSGERSDYDYVDPDTGEILSRNPEFCRMSLKPGIGALWLERFRSDVYPDGTMVCGGVKVKAPRYYDKLQERFDPDVMEAVKQRREMMRSVPASEMTRERLAVKGQVLTARANFLKREFEK